MMKYKDEKGCLIYVTDYGSGGRVWTAIYAESGQPVSGIGTHVTQRDAQQALYEMARDKGWTQSIKREIK